MGEAGLTQGCFLQRALPRDVSVGDKLIALRSSGVHSNGYSLVRHLVDGSGLTWADQSPFSEGTLGTALLAPTRLYVKPSLAALKAGGVHALTNITGGGLSENIPRALDEGQGISIDLNTCRSLSPECGVASEF